MEVNESLLDKYHRALRRGNPIEIGLNDCPTLDNKINCSVCTHECKLRLQLDQSKVETSPESLPADIYY